MTQEIMTTRPNYLIPQTFEQAERYAEKIANSSLCPISFKGKPTDVLIAMQMGAEVGLSPMQALQNIAVINGRPSIWGDAALGVVRCHPHCSSIREWFEGSISDGTLNAFCGVQRKGQTEEIRSFSMEQAKKAGLWSKQGTWTQYPERMLQMRARGFAIRDVFPDALRGLNIAEEAQDIIDIKQSTYEIVNEYKKNERIELSLTQETDAFVLQAHLDDIEKCETIDDLRIVYMKAKENTKGDKESSNKISIATKEKQKKLKEQQFLTTSQEETKKSHQEFLAAYNS